MSDIFREVDEAMQQEKLLKIWNEYKNTIIGAIAVLIISAALTTSYHSWNNNRNATETQRLMEAVASDDPQSAIAAIIEDTRKNHQALGLFTMAGLALEKGEKDKAATLYQKAAESRKTPRDLRDFARILYIQNTATPTLDILKPLLANEKSPRIWHARIEAAVIAANINQDYAKAIQYLENFETVTTIPLSLKQRGTSLKHVYTLKQKNQNNKEGAE